METSAPLFKGATRPACIWGIPMKPFACCVGVFILLGFWVWIPLMLLMLPSLIVLRRIAKDDDQRYLQLFLYFKVNVLGAGNRAFWGGVRSFGPVSYRNKYKKG